ncbi:MAG TPA: hypothetical protein VNO55_01465, partial [Polyangia bacterium]|nr:hypothetical protein [Polyangia bacterium]
MVKARGAGIPTPANDTLPPGAITGPADETVLEPEALAGDIDLAEEVTADVETDEVALEATAEVDAEAADDDEESETEEAEAPEGVVAKKKRAEDEPTSFLAMYFR